MLVANGLHLERDEFIVANLKYLAEGGGLGAA